MDAKGWVAWLFRAFVRGYYRVNLSQLRPDLMMIFHDLASAYTPRRCIGARLCGETGARGALS
jgi:hypothetical protein